LMGVNGIVPRNQVYFYITLIALNTYAKTKF